jgi:hypothetical protein
MERIIIAKCEFEEEECREYIELLQAEETFIVKLFETIDDQFELISERSIPIPLLVAHGALFGIFLDNYKNITEPIDMSTINNSRDGINILALLNISTNRPLLLVYSYDGEYCVICNKPLKSDLSFIVRNKNEYSADVLSEIFGESYIRRRNITREKRSLLAAIDPNASLACLEAQVDILTTIVLLLLNNTGTRTQIEDQLPKIIDFEQVFRETNLITIKDIGDCLREMRDTKAKIRKLQAKYYAVKRGIVMR